MAKRPSEVALPVHERLRDSKRQMTSMALPLAVHDRLDRLARQAEDVNASRAEVVAMLIAAADLDTDEMERRILAYRKLTVGDLIPAKEREGDQESVVVQMRGPGRPRRDSAG